MTDRTGAARSAADASSSSSAPSVRPRNRRLVSTGDDGGDNDDNAGGLLSVPVASAYSSVGKARGGGSRRTARHAADADANIGQFLEESWAQSWSSVSSFASSLLGGADASKKGKGAAGWAPTHNLGQPQQSTWQRPPSSSTRNKPDLSWGPLPPHTPQLNVVAAGSLAERESAVMAAKKASVLQSHDGVNGGLDVTGRHKRRGSDDAVAIDDAPPDDYFVYVHTVQPSDTYQSLILRYRCREDAFRKANGLWSRDSVQTRKWLVFPVDTCEIRGRPCDAPSWQNYNKVDLLAPTPSAADENRSEQGGHDDFFSRPVNGEAPPAPDQEGLDEEDDKPWKHVRWVTVDSIQEPVEIGRVSRHKMGYFPPRRRRKSIRTLSTISTPRQSIDLSSVGPPGSVERRSSRRQSSLSSRPQLAGTPLSTTRSRGGSDAADGRPAWMRRPGGVGSMGRSVRAPGPDKDYFNTWVTKHVPGLNVEGMSSMSIMGSETANFGFGKDGSTIAESPYEEGRDITSATRQGTGLDRAASAVETWLRGALARNPSGSPLMTGRGLAARRQQAGDPGGDLIELADTGSDDGRLGVDSSVSMMTSLSLGSGARSDGGGSVRGRTVGGAGAKGQKAD